MSYVVLARKYRPQNFDDVVGQNPVSQTLLNALESGRVAHAYIFSGPRGVGKTTTARILAKCLNCEKGPTKNPCQKCASCQSITDNNSVDDVLEIDGASNRGIEQIRELRENAKYAPARSRYRIYIIDEAHQITKDAFGALLKTLEEPPSHVVFMMATTEVQKIPAPILSRCQRFSLRPISSELVLKHLKNICVQEKINVEEEALANIIRFVEGSMRDALSLLDQAIVFSPEKITLQAVRDLLGLLPLETIRKTALAIQAGDPTAILQQIDECAKNGIDLTQLGKDLQHHFHNLLLAKAGVPDPFDVNRQETEKEATQHDFAQLERYIRLLSKALEDMRYSETPRAVFEIYILRMGQKVWDVREILNRLEQLEKSGPATPAITPTTTITNSFMGAKVGIQTIKPKEITQSQAPVAKAPKTLADDGIKTKPPASDFNWTEFLDEVLKVKMTLGSTLQEAKYEMTQQGVQLSVQSSFHQDLLTRSMDILKSTAMKLFGSTPTFIITVDKTTSKDTKPKNSLTNPGTSSLAKLPEADDLEEVSSTDIDPELQKALKHFPGTLKREKSS
ncbi:MAG: DNA polymerase III subunit gamma/tau [Elusimicrobiota bacterium]